MNTTIFTVPALPPLTSCSAVLSASSIAVPPAARRSPAKSPAFLRFSALASLSPLNSGSA
jgi:hypothetical protein